MTGTALAERKDVPALMELHQDRITPFLPKGMTFQRVIGEVALAASENPTLLECTPESIVRGVIRALRMDLEIGVDFFLVPFRDRGQMVCTGIPGYRGLADLAQRCGAARSVEAHCVYEGESFKIEHGLVPQLYHHPHLIASDRGKLLGAYYIIKLGRGKDPLFDFLPIADIEAVRKMSKQWSPEKVRECPPWWAEKRAILKGLKLVPKNAAFAAKLALWEEGDAAEFVAPIDQPRIAQSSDAGDIVGDSAENGQAPRVYTAPVRTPPPAAGSGTPAQDARVAAAKALAFPFQKDKKNSLYGKPLGEIKSEGLRKVASWIRERQDETPGFHQVTLEAIGLVLGDREKEQEVMQLETDSASPKQNPTALAPGKVSDALPKNAPDDLPSALLDEDDDLPF